MLDIIVMPPNPWVLTTKNTKIKFLTAFDLCFGKPIFPQQSVNCLWISEGLRSNWCHRDWRLSSLLKSWPVRIGIKNAGLERSGGVLIGSGDWLSFLYPRYPQWWGSVPYLVPWLRYDMNCFFIVHFKKKIFQMSKICLASLPYILCVAKWIV